MTIDQLKKVLEAESGVRAEAGGSGDRSAFLVSDDVDLTILIDMNHEALAVTRVRRVTLDADLLMLETHKGERVYTGPTVRALKFATSDANKARGTGFLPGR